MSCILTMCKYAGKQQYVLLSDKYQPHTRIKCCSYHSSLFGSFHLLNSLSASCNCLSDLWPAFASAVGLQAVYATQKGYRETHIIRALAAWHSQSSIRCGRHAFIGIHKSFTQTTALIRFAQQFCCQTASLPMPTWHKWQFPKRAENQKCKIYCTSYGSVAHCCLPFGILQIKHILTYNFGDKFDWHWQLNLRYVDSIFVVEQKLWLRQYNQNAWPKQIHYVYVTYETGFCLLFACQLIKFCFSNLALVFYNCHTNALQIAIATP